MDSGGSPENCRKIVKKSKIDDFGGPSENPRKIVLGSVNIVKKCQKIVLWATKILFFDNNIVAASGRSQKRGGGLRPPPLFWTILLSKNSILVAQRTIFLHLLTILRLPRTIFRGFSQGPPKSSILHIFTIFRQFSGDPPEFIKILFFDNFRSIGDFIDCAGPAQCKLSV